MILKLWGKFSYMQEKLIYYGAYLLALSAFALTVFFITKGGSPYPYSDDWGLVPIISGDTPFSIDWLWEPHVDHLIPAPKALWVWVLRESNLDFRSGMALNAVGAFLASMCLIFAIRLFRGSSSIGDLLIPLVLLNPAFNIFYWSFLLQFTLSVTLSLIAIAFGLLHFKVLRSGFALAASIAIFLLNGVGMNGAVLAIILAFSMLAALVADRKNCSRWELNGSIALNLATLCTSAYIFAIWSPSDASRFGPSDTLTILKNSIDPLISLTAPRAWVTGIFSTKPYLLLGFICSCAASGVIISRILRNPTGANLYLTGSFLSCWGLLAAIAIGRSSFWSPGSEFHYGYFPVITLITGWIILSTTLSKILVRYVAVALLLVFGSMYISGVNWAIAYSNERSAQLFQVKEDLANDVDLRVIAKNNIALFWWKNDEQSIEMIAQSLRLLKVHGAQTNSPRE